MGAAAPAGSAVGLSPRSGCGTSLGCGGPWYHVMCPDTQLFADDSLLSILQSNKTGSQTTGPQDPLHPGSLKPQGLL